MRYLGHYSHPLSCILYVLATSTSLHTWTFYLFFSLSLFRFPEIHIGYDHNSYPIIKFEGDAGSLVNKLGITASHVSISHDGDYAVAHVVCEKWE
jgi:hypothetical protein